MTTSQQILAFFDGAIKYHQERISRFQKARGAFVDGTPEPEPELKPTRAPKGSRLEQIKKLLGGVVRDWAITDICYALSIPRSTVSDVLHKHNRTFVYHKDGRQWSLRNGK